MLSHPEICMKLPYSDGPNLSGNVPSHHAGHYPRSHSDGGQLAVNGIEAGKPHASSKQQNLGCWSRSCDGGGLGVGLAVSARSRSPILAQHAPLELTDSCQQNNWGRSE